MNYSELCFTKLRQGGRGRDRQSLGTHERERDRVGEQETQMRERARKIERWMGKERVDYVKADMSRRELERQLSCHPEPSHPLHSPQGSLEQTAIPLCHSQELGSVIHACPLIATVRRHPHKCDGVAAVGLGVQNETDEKTEREREREQEKESSPCFCTSFKMK